MERRAVVGEDEHGFIADLHLLRKCIKEAVKEKRAVVVGHLLPLVFLKREVDFVAILRCSPFELERRCLRRGYANDKVRDNVASEILGICVYEALKKFGREKIAEFDTTGREVHSVSEEVVKVLARKRPRRIALTDWLQMFTDAQQLRRFFN